MDGKRTKVSLQRQKSGLPSMSGGKTVVWGDIGTIAAGPGGKTFLQ